MTNPKDEPKGFRRFRKKAEEMAKNPGAIASLLESASAKVHGLDQDAKDGAEGKGGAKPSGIARVRGDLLDMLRMIRAYFKGEYRHVPWTTIVTAIGGVLYFVNPMDLIPDFLVGPGLIDDATVLAFCLNGLRRDLKDFISWEQKGDA